MSAATISAANRLGMPVADYRSERAAGRRWCSWHQAFEPAGAFRATRRRTMSSCEEGDRERAKVGMRRVYAARRAAS